MPKNPSEDLFNEIVKHGLHQITEFVNKETTEHYYLDFKTTQTDDYTAKTSLLDDDKKNYAKAISAFGNSDGGVLVWGIGTGGKEDDSANILKPIKHVSQFCSLLEGATSILTIPPHPNITHKVIIEEEQTNSGYVVTHISKSNHRPFQVIKGFVYYIRAGNSSMPASDTFLRYLFGKDPQAEVYQDWKILVPPRLVSDNQTIQFELLFLVFNKGEGVAKNINGYLQVIGDGSKVEASSSQSFCYNYSRNKLKVGFMALDNFKLGIDQEAVALRCKIILNEVASESGLTITSLVSCDGQMAYRQDKTFSKIELEKIYKTFREDIKLYKAVRDSTLVEAMFGENVDTIR